MNAKNQTPAQILNLLRESETRDPERHADKTVVLKDDEKTTTETFGFFKAEAHKRPTDAGWSYDDQIEPGNEIHIWRTNYDKPGDRTTPETTTLVFETSHEARTQAADHLETIVREAGMTRTDAYRDNAKGTDYARYTLEVPADQADDTGRSIALDMTANGIRTSWHVATSQDVDLLDPQVLRAELNRTKEILTQTKDERNSLQTAWTVLWAELNQTREILTQTQTERDQARTELKATIDAHQEKPITLNGRETQILDALIEAGAIKQARTLFYERDVIQAKLRTHTELDGSERETLLGLVRDANENEIPWTNDDFPF